MRAILIDPFVRQITEIDFAGGLEEIYQRLGCQTIEAIHLPEHHACYIDEEGKLIDLSQQSFFRLLGDEPGRFLNIAGRGLIVGTDHEGDDIDATLSLDWVREHVAWPDHDVAAANAAIEVAAGPRIISFDSPEEMLEFLQKQKGTF